MDHGKTELVKALTGVDTDRLEEEKRRGLTIDLGFAPLDLPKSGRVGIVDVPGHIHFLKNMLAGVGGIDLAILVVAADEGVMPQTKEHFQILRLLRVPQMVVVISKIDSVSSDIVELVIEEVRELLKDTYLESSPIVRTSSVTGEGLEDLKGLLDSIISAFPPKNYQKPPRLPIDRVFVLKGVGTVITGSLISGRISQGEEVLIYPKMIKTRVRQIQVFKERKEEALAGNRVALNLVGVGKDEIERGDVISKPGFLNPTRMLDVRLEILPEVSLVKDWTRVRLYMGSAEVLGRIAILGEREIQGGQQAYCQIRLEDDITAVFGDRFVLRSYSPMRLLGGGVVLDPNPVKHKRFDKGVIEILTARAKGDLREILTAELRSRYLKRDDLKRNLNVEEDRINAVIKDLRDEGRIEVLGDYLFDKERLKGIKQEIVKTVRQFHREQPLKFTVSKEELKTKFPFESELFNKILSTIDEIQVLGDKIRLKYQKISFTPEQLIQREKIEKAFIESRFSPPSREEILKKYAPEVFYYLVERGVLIRINEEIFLHKDLLEEAKTLIEDHIKKHGEIRLSQLRDLLNTTRKYAVPLAEYLDGIGFTERVGDVRRLHGGG